jgi:16S rRNA (guanine966-N2)-methyltransferase
MKLRIISGELKGRYVSADGITFRPTQERVREAAANVVGRRALGAAAADFCAGSGAFGFEMASRGAASVDFVEIDKMSAVRIADNARALGVGDRVTVRREDVRKVVEENAARYDVIYYDPPYGFAEFGELIPKLVGLLTERGVLVYERRRLRHEKKAADTSGKKNVIDARIYSDTVVEFYGRGEDADSALSGDV